MLVILYRIDITYWNANTDKLGISDLEDAAIAIRRKLNSSYTHSNLSWLSKAIQLQITATKNR